MDYLKDPERCRCRVLVEDQIVRIIPCGLHRGLTGEARWRWLEDVLAAATYRAAERLVDALAP